MTRDHERTSRLSRLATAGAVGYCVVFALLELGLIGITDVDGWTDALRAAIATAAYLPFHIRHVWYAARAQRPPGGVWTLSVMAVVILGTLPVIGAAWFPAFHALAVSGLIVLRRPWAHLAVAAMIGSSVPLALALDSTWELAWRYPIAIAWRGSTLFVLVWLAAAVHRLEVARRALAHDAVVRERVRIDAELRETVGAALGAIAAGGERAGNLVASDPKLLRAELESVVAGSRRTLADARRIIRGYQRSSPRSELDTAAALLTAAGIDTRLELPADGLPDGADESLRAELRSITAALLEHGEARTCVVTAVRDGGRVRLEVSVDRGRTTMAVSA